MGPGVSVRPTLNPGHSGTCPERAEVVRDSPRNWQRHPTGAPRRVQQPLPGSEGRPRPTPLADGQVGAMEPPQASVSEPQGSLARLGAAAARSEARRAPQSSQELQ